MGLFSFFKPETGEDLALKEARDFTEHIANHYSFEEQILIVERVIENMSDTKDKQIEDTANYLERLKNIKEQLNQINK